MINIYKLIEAYYNILMLNITMIKCKFFQNESLS